MTANTMENTICLMMVMPTFREAAFVSYYFTTRGLRLS